MSEERRRDSGSVSFGELPELTGALRALGSTRKGGAAQTMLFAPLLDARRRAADARSPQSRVLAFDATDLRRALDRAIERIIAEWPDARLQARRALRAALSERVEPYALALRSLSERAAAVLDADDAGALVAWRAWTLQLAAVFEAADRSWLSIRAVVDELSKKSERPAG